MPDPRQNNSSERLFAQLCAIKYLKGFVFHSPTYGDHSEYEAGDVVLWVRNQIVVFEIIWRNIQEGNGTNTKSFIKKIGKKRDQLVKDFEIFKSIDNTLELVNEAGEKVKYDKDNFHPENFSGIVLIDSDENVEKLNYYTIEKALHEDFPIAFITNKDFTDLTTEIDTIPDLNYYLKDRFDFFKVVYPDHNNYFREINKPIEKNLVALYKMNEYSFPIEKWQENEKKNYYEIFQTDYADKIAKRNAENSKSFVIDEIIDEIRNKNGNGNFTVLHASELAIFSRRERAKIAPKIIDAFEKFEVRIEPRYFSYYNANTECWVLFYFLYTDDIEDFRNSFKEYCQLKLFFEMHDKGFQYSIFGYGFRKSTNEEENAFSEMNLLIEDACKYAELNLEMLKKAVKLFGHIKIGELKEFPD